MKTPSPSASLSAPRPPPWPTSSTLHRMMHWDEPRDVLRATPAAEKAATPAGAAAAYGCVDWFMYPDSLD